jgi:hypothetical protein
MQFWLSCSQRPKTPEYLVSDCNRNQVKKHANEPTTNYNRKTRENCKNKKHKKENVSDLLLDGRAATRRSR